MNYICKTIIWWEIVALLWTTCTMLDRVTGYVSKNLPNSLTEQIEPGQQ